MRRIDREVEVVSRLIPGLQLCPAADPLPGALRELLRNPNCVKHVSVRLRGWPDGWFSTSVIVQAQALALGQDMRQY